MTTQLRARPTKNISLSRSVSETIAAWLPISLILLLATFLFAFRIGNEGLWLDELNSVQDATQNTVGHYLAKPIRPLYYLVLMAWMNLGSSDAWLRSISAIFSVISVFLLYRIGRRLAGEREGLIAALLLAISPLIVHHAQEIRMYALSLCLGLAGTTFLVDALLVERGQKPSQKTMAGWMIFRLLGIYTVPLNILILLPDVIAIALRFRQQRAVLVSFAKWLGLMLLLWSPAVLSVGQASSPNSDYANDHSGATPPGFAEVFRLFKFFTVWPFSVQESAPVALFYKVFTLFVAGLMGAGIIRKHRSPKLLWVLAWCVLPVIPILCFSHWVMPIWKTRYVLFVSPYFFILLAAGFTRLWKEWRIAAVTMAVAYAITVSGGLFHYYTVQERPDYKFNVATLEQHERLGDGMVWSYECCESGLRRYYDGPMDVYKNSVNDIESTDDIPQWLSNFPTGYDRLWLVLDGAAKDKAVIEAAIADSYQIEMNVDYEQGSKVMLLTPLEGDSQQASVSSPQAITTSEQL